MSLLTQCPACNTLYKVVPDQLRISDGWVKCGQCHEIFDASTHMFELAATNDLSVPVAEVTPESVDAVGANVAEAQVAVAATSDDVVLPEPESPQDNQVVQDVAPVTHADQQIEGPLPLEHHETGTIEQPVLDQLTFLKADTSSAQSGRYARPALVAVVFFLLVGVVLQWAFYDRDQLVSRQPMLKPMAQTICANLGCTLRAPAHIESILIDAAGFNKLNQDTYRLSFIVKNTSAYDVAVPDIELTLMDASEQVIFRRVLNQAELGATFDVIVGGAEWPVSTFLHIKPDAQPARVVGYRFLAFYP